MNHFIWVVELFSLSSLDVDDNNNRQTDSNNNKQIVFNT